MRGEAVSPYLVFSLMVGSFHGDEGVTYKWEKMFSGGWIIFPPPTSLELRNPKLSVRFGTSLCISRPLLAGARGAAFIWGEQKMSSVICHCWLCRQYIYHVTYVSRALKSRWGCLWCFSCWGCAAVRLKGDLCPNVNWRKFWRRPLVPCQRGWSREDCLSRTWWPRVSPSFNFHLKNSFSAVFTSLEKYV